MGKARAAPAWRRGFLRALGESGNVRLAARRAGVDHSTAYALRRSDADFGKRWDVAVARAAARAAAGELRAPASVTVEGPGGETAGLVVRRSRNAGAQVVRAGPGRWSVAVEGAFLAALARTACVKRAAEAVGLSTVAVYNRRKADAGLRARWAEALGAGEERIGEFLTAAVLAAFDPEVAASGVPAASVAEALAIAKWKGIGGAKTPAGTQVRDVAGMRARVLAQIAAIKKARGRVADGAAGQERGT